MSELRILLGFTTTLELTVLASLAGGRKAPPGCRRRDQWETES